MSRARGLLFLALSFASGCARDDVVVATTVPDASEAASPPRDAGVDAPEAAPDDAPPGDCTQTSDCAPNAFCSRASCEAHSGTCALRPILCDDTLDAVCGCDGVTYWNDCLRERSGTGASTPGQCDIGDLACGPDTPCPGGASCAHLVPPMGPCPMMFPGACWLLPDTCPTHPPAPGSWVECGAQPPMCTDTCNAIRAGTPHQSVPSCP
jgi:hypothetical protein